MIKGLQRQIYKENTNIPDKEQGFDHMNDALGYLIDYIKPLTSDIPYSKPARCEQLNNGIFKRLCIKRTQRLQRNVSNWEYYIRSYNGGYDYTFGQYLNRYNLELDNEFNQRLANTPCDNHCRNVIQIYSSFLFRVKPSRDFGSMTEEQSLDTFLKDADLDGNNFNNVIKQAQNYSSIYGHCFMILDKPNLTLGTRAEELQQEVRPYISIVTPENVLDWNFKREPNGKYVLDYLKIREEVDKDGGTYIRVWFPDRIETVYGR